MITITEARRHYAAADTAHDFEHVLRVWRLVQRIGPAEGADMTVLQAATLLHDVARADELRTGVCHAAEGARRARDILAGHPPAQVEAVAHAIAAHRFRGDVAPATLEARVLYDADKLDAMGAIGIARAYAIAGLLGQPLWTPLPTDDTARRRDLSADHSPVREFAVKLRKLRDALHTPTAQAIAQGRHEFMEQYFARLEQEVHGVDSVCR
jgi:uncharacterized protein